MTESRSASRERLLAVAPLEHLPSLREAQAWIGFRLEDVGGSGCGRIEGVLVDSEDGEPAWIVARTRLRHRSALPVEHVAPAAGRVWVPFAKEAIRAAPEIDPEKGLDRDRELELYEHFGVPAGSGRRTRVEAAGSGQPTSVAAGSSPAR